MASANALRHLPQAPSGGLQLQGPGVLTDTPVTNNSHFKSRAIKNRRSVVGEIAAGRNAEGRRRFSP
jgi:hypothetical protein